MTVFTAIGAAIFGAGTFLAGITAAGLQIAAGIAVNLIGQALSGQPQSDRNAFSTQVQVRAGDDVPRSINFGWNVTAGSYVYFNTWGSANAYLTQVIALGDVPVREMRRVFIDNSPVTLLTGQEHGQYGYPASEYRKGGVDHLWVKFYDGTQTSADSFLVNTVSGGGRSYNTNRIGRGIPYVIVTARAPERDDGAEKPLFQGMPSVMVETYGMPLYDPSRDSSVGGSGSHRWDDPSTWGGDGDFLPAVQLYNILRGIRYGGQWLYGLQDVSAARLPAANWIAAINKCRQTISGETQYRSGGELPVGTPIKDAIDSLLTACQGRLVEVGGSYKLYVGEPDAPVYSFTDADIISTEEQSFTPFFSLSDTINGIQSTFPNPAEAWNRKAAPPLYRSAFETEDGNRRLMASIALDMVPYSEQVQRLQLSALREARRARRHTLVLGAEAWVLEPGDIIQWTSARNGYEDKLFRVDGVADKANLDVMIDITEVDPSDYDWNPETDYEPVIDGPVDLVGPQPLPMQGWDALPAILYDEEGRARRPAIEVWFSGGFSDVYSVRIQARAVGQTDNTFDGEVPYGPPYRVILNGQFAPDTLYEVRGIFVRDSGNQSSWSSWIEVTTPDIKLTGLDVDFEDIAEDVGEFVAGMFDWTVYNTRETIERNRAEVLATIRGDIGAYTDRQLLREQVTSVTDNERAAYTRDILVATGPNSALAMRIEELQAEVFDPDTGIPALASAVDLLETRVDDPGTGLEANANAILALSSEVGEISAEGLFRVYTSATPAGANARIALSVSATEGGDPTTAAMFMDAMSDGTSEIALVAGRVSIVTGTGGGATKYDLFTVQGGVAYISSARILDASIGTAKIENAAITTAKIENLAVTTAKIDDLAVTNAKIANLTVTAAKIADATITSAKIGNLEVERIKIANGAVTDIDKTQQNLAPGQVIASHNVGSVTRGDLVFAGAQATLTMTASAFLIEYRVGSGAWQTAANEQGTGGAMSIFGIINVPANGTLNVRARAGGYPAGVGSGNILLSTQTIRK